MAFLLLPWRTREESSRNLLEKVLDLEQRLRMFRVELHKVPGCLCNTERVPFITLISQIVSFRGSEVSHSIRWSSIFKRGEILKICPVINHHSFSGWSPQKPEIRRKMRFSVLGLWLRHCDSGNLLPDNCSARHSSFLFITDPGFCVEKEAKGCLNKRLWKPGSGGEREERGEKSEVRRSEQGCCNAAVRTAVT